MQEVLLLANVFVDFVRPVVELPVSYSKRTVGEDNRNVLSLIDDDDQVEAVIDGVSGLEVSLDLTGDWTNPDTTRNQAGVVKICSNIDVQPDFTADFPRELFLDAARTTFSSSFTFNDIYTIATGDSSTAANNTITIQNDGLHVDSGIHVATSALNITRTQKMLSSARL